MANSETGTTTVLHTTQHHPFWDATDQRWVDASELQPGHRLLVHDDQRLEGDSTGAGMGGGGPGTVVTVVAVIGIPGSKAMRDLTVAEIHTYYVLTGNTPVLVHNCGGRHSSSEVAEDSGYVGRHQSSDDETYYRTMSQDHYDQLSTTGRLPATRETFISPTRSFSDSYDGVT